MKRVSGRRLTGMSFYLFWIPSINLVWGYLSVGSLGHEQTPVLENIGRYETWSELGVITFSAAVFGKKNKKIFPELSPDISRLWH